MNAEIIDYKKENITHIATLLKEGKIGILPSDTIYGMSGVIGEETSEKIYKAKNRPENKRLIVLMDTEALKHSDLIVPEALFSLWPAPLTAILSSRIDGSTTAVRVPKDEFLLSLIKESGPIYSTSANLSGTPALNSFEKIYSVFSDRVDFIVKREGKEDALSSTLIDATSVPFKVIRQGSYILP